MQGFALRFLLFSFKDKMNTRVLDELVRRFYAVGFVFPCDVAIEAHRKAYARFSNDFLLFLVFEKFRHVRVGFEFVHTVEIDVEFPENPVFRHFTKIPIGFFAYTSDKREHICVRNPRRTATTLGIRENIAFDNGIFRVQIFH